MLPVGQEPRVRVLRHGLDAAADRRERAHAQAPQHLRVAPLGLIAIQRAARRRGQEEAARHPSLRLEPLERVPRDGDADAETLRHGIRRERAVRAREARDQVAERIGERLEECGRDADGQRHAERIAQPPGVFDGRDARRSGDRDGDRAAAVDQRVEQRGGGRPRDRPACVRSRPLGLQAGGDLGGVERTEDAEQVGDAFDAACAPLGIETLRLALELGDHVGVEQLAHLDPAEQFGQQRGIHRQRGGTPLGEGRVALVHERADIAEEQVAGERRGL